jgi:iron(III) transport system ATP-binding protein
MEGPEKDMDTDAGLQPSTRHALDDRRFDGEPPMIRIDGITKTFKRRSGGGETKPVDNISLEVRRGEMVVLLGPSGCGKTTLLRCVAGLEKPDSGAIHIQGRTVWDPARATFVPPNKRSVSMIFQSYALWPHMTVFGNVAYPLRARRLPAQQIRDRVTSTLNRVGLDGLENQYPAQLSGGQQQRVALARALVSGAEVMLFDEPLSNVDARVRDQLRAELVEMRRDLGLTGLYVTHDQHEALELGDRVVVLDRGRIEQIATPVEVYSAPRSRYVAEFVGAANVFPFTVEKAGSGSLRGETPLGPMTTDAPGPDWRGDELVSGVEVYAMARPENCEVSALPQEGPNVWEGKVARIDFAGSHVQCVIDVGASTVRAWVPRETPISEGQAVWVRIDTSHLRVLPSTYSISHQS